MAKMGSADFSELKKLQENLNKMVGSEDARTEFFEECAKLLAEKLLRLVIGRTPVGNYPKSSGKKGGTLRRGWTAGKEVEQAISCFEVRKEGDLYSIEITNPVEYASYVEFGHRKANGKGIVEPRHMMTKSENEIKRMGPKILEKKIVEFLGGAFDAK